MSRRRGRTVVPTLDYAGPRDPQSKRGEPITFAERFLAAFLCCLVGLPLILLLMVGLAGIALAVIAPSGSISNRPMALAIGLGVSAVAAATLYAFIKDVRDRRRNGW